VALILLADDDEMLLPLVVDALLTQGHEVITAVDGERACDLTRNHAFDLIVLDYDMPKRTGLEVLTQLKITLPSLPPTIMLTAKGDPETVRKCVGAGARDFIVKPFEVAELLRRIDRQLGEGG
jgi:two-component system sensor histidine kinase RpfC